MTENELSKIVVNAAFKIHVALGPGLLESAYEACLLYELKELGLNVRSQVILPIIYQGIYLDINYRIDILLEDRLIIEIKSVKELHDVHFSQVLTYLKLSNHKLGLLINFNVAKIKDGIKRVINGNLD
jgi:GxxExxY protein